MRVVLKENIEHLGNKGDIVNVAAGYGRNYLIPKKLALEVTPSNAKMIEMEQRALKKNLEKARMSYQDIIQRLGSTTLSFVRKAAEKDVIFGSVSVTDIKDELDKRGFSIEKKKILLSEPIKRLGNYSIPIKVFLDDKAEIGVHVVSEEEAKQEGDDLSAPKAPLSEEIKETGEAQVAESVVEKAAVKESAEKSQNAQDGPSGEPQERIEEEASSPSDAVESGTEKETPEPDAKEGEVSDGEDDKTSP